MIGNFWGLVQSWKMYKSTLKIIEEKEKENKKNQKKETKNKMEL